MLATSNGSLNVSSGGCSRCPKARRGVDAARLRERSQLIIGHDSEYPAYGYDQVFDQFKHRFTYSRQVPWTTVVNRSPP